MSLTFERLRQTNATRLRRWHSEDNWTGSDWSNAMCGEAGEAANVVKKLRRIELGGAADAKRELSEEDLIRDLGFEIADVVIYADLLAKKYGINLEAAVVEKFNIVSERWSFPERL